MGLHVTADSIASNRRCALETGVWISGSLPKRSPTRVLVIVRVIVHITVMIVLVMVSFFEIKSGFPNALFWFLYELKYALGRKNLAGQRGDETDHAGVHCSPGQRLLTARGMGLGFWVYRVMGFGLLYPVSVFIRNAAAKARAAAARSRWPWYEHERSYSLPSTDSGFRAARS